jgi:flagellar capping protein FliD
MLEGVDKMTISGINPLAIQGLASSLDTETIIEEIMKSRQAQLDALEAKREKLVFRKTALRNFNTQLLALQQTLLDLKLSTTFNMKSATSSDTGVVAAKAQSTATAGQHSVKVTQMAKPAQVSSNVYTPRLSSTPANTAGITGISGALAATPMYLLGDVFEGATVDTIGQTISAGTNNNNLNLTVDGTKITVTLADATADSTTLSAVMTDLETKINDAMNVARGTGGVKYVVASKTNTAGAANDKLYLMSNFDGAGFTISVDSTSSAAEALGFGATDNITTMAGTDPAGGNHNITITAATAANIQGTPPAAIDSSVDFTGDQITVNINGTLHTVNFENNYTNLDALALDLDTKLAGVVDVSVQSGKIVFTDANYFGSSNSIIITDSAGAPCAKMGLTSGVTASGTNARAVDVYTPAVGATITRTVEDTTDTGTNSTMAGLLEAINGVDPRTIANHTLAGGGPLIAGITFTGTLTAGTALINTGSGNELNTSVATSATYSSASDIATTTLTLTGTLSAAGFKTAPGTATNGTFTINGKTITITDYTTTTVNDVLAKINASGAGVTASYDSVNDRFVLKANATGSSQTITIGSGSDTSNFLTMAGFYGTDAAFSAGSDKGAIDPTKPLGSASFSVIPTSGIFTINDVMIYINASTDSMNDVVKKINESTAGVTASYNSSTDTFSLVSNDSEYGRDVISLGSAADTSNFFYATKLVYPPNFETDGTPTVLNTTISEAGQPGRRALFEVDGTAYNRKSNEITDVITGVSLTLQSAQASSGTPVTINITASTDQVKEKIKNFIVEYNKTVQMANPQPLTKEEREDQLPELTDDQLESMSYSKSEAYNANRDALRQREVLRQETSVMTIYHKLRRLITTPVEGVSSKYNTLRQVGLGTGDVTTSWDWDENPYGMLLVASTDPEEVEAALSESSKFMSLLEADPGEMARLFAQMQDATFTREGTENASSVVVAGEMKVRVGNGKTSTEITIAPGTYTGGKLADTINSSLSSAGITDMLFTLNSSNKLQVTSCIYCDDEPNGQGFIDLTDIQGNLFSSVLGLTPGFYSGPTVFSTTGAARRLENFCKEYTKINGVLYNKTKASGDIDREIGYVDDRIDEFEDRMTLEKERLWKVFTNLEKVMSDANTKSQWLSQRLSALNSSSS